MTRPNDTALRGVFWAGVLDVLAIVAGFVVFGLAVKWCAQ